MNHHSSLLIATAQIDDRLREADQRRLANAARASTKRDSILTRIGRLIGLPRSCPRPRPSTPTEVSGW